MRQSWSYIYVGLWHFWYAFRIKYLGVFASIAVFVLSAIEMAGALTHLLPETTLPKWLSPLWRTHWIHYVLASLLFFSAWVLIWHHSRLKKKNARLQELLFFVMVMAQEISELESDYTPRAAAITTLDALTHALEYRGGASPNEKNFINATILIQRHHYSEVFEIYAQDSNHAFRDDLCIPAEDSVAGKVVKYDSDHKVQGTMLYVPSTRCVHGIALSLSKESHEVFENTEIIPAPYKVLDEATERYALRSLLCVQIPLKRNLSHAGESYSKAVLSLSAQKVDSLDSVCFTGAKLAVNLLAELL